MKKFLCIAMVMLISLARVWSQEEDANKLPSWFFKTGGTELVGIGVSDLGQDSVTAIEQAVHRAKTMLAFLNHSVAGTFVSTNLGAYNESYYHSSSDMELLYTVNYFGVLTDSNLVAVTDTFFTEYNEAVVRATIALKPYDTSAHVVFASKISRQVGVEKGNRQFVCTHDKAYLSSLAKSKEKQHYELDVNSNLYSSMFSDGLIKTRRTSLNRTCTYKPGGNARSTLNIPIDAGLESEIQNGLWPAVFSSFVKSLSLTASYYNSNINLLSSSGIQNNEGGVNGEFNESLQSAKNYNLNSFSFRFKGISISENGQLQCQLKPFTVKEKVHAPGAGLASEMVYHKQVKELEKQKWTIYNDTDYLTLLSYANFVTLNGGENFAVHSFGEALAYSLNTASIVALELAKLNAAAKLQSSVMSNSNTNIGNETSFSMQGTSLTSHTVSTFNKVFLLYKPAMKQLNRAKVHVFYIP